jgi:hypothetical protein
MFCHFGLSPEIGDSLLALLGGIRILQPHIVDSLELIRHPEQLHRFQPLSDPQ